MLNMTKRILITGAGGSAASNVIQSLRMNRESLYLVGSDINPYLLELTAGLDKKYILPPASHPSYLGKLNKLIQIEHIEFIHAQPDSEVFALSRLRDKVHAKLFLPDSNTIAICQDKMKLNSFLSQSGVPMPKTIQLTNNRSLKDAFKLLQNHPLHPVWIRTKTGAGSKASLPIISVSIAEKWIEFWIQLRRLRYTDFIACEFLPGTDIAFQSVWNDGKLVTSATRMRLSYVFGEYTLSGQSSSPAVAKSIHRDDVNEYAIKAVQTLDPHATGIFCIDMKENAQSQPRITEINCGRFFTTSNFFSTAGCNMPSIVVKLAYHEPVSGVLKVNAVPSGWYWIRTIDMGTKLVKGEKWTSKKVT
jgi:carbamoylphosphate synthase large subunit